MIRRLDQIGLALSLAALLAALIWAFPLIFALQGGARGMDAGAWWRALTETPVGLWYLNSLFTSVGVTALGLALAAPCAYALSQMRFAGRSLLWAMILASFLIPAQALIVNHFLLVNRLGLINTWGGIILPQLIAPVTVIVYKRFFDALPKELREAAELDGATHWQMLWRIYLPLTRGVSAALAIILFIGAWNAFLWPFLASTRAETMTITVAVSQARAAWGVSGLVAALLAALPVAVFYLVFQRRVTEAVAVSAGIKG